MAEVKINQLPVTTSSSFTSNDYFLIVDDGNARLLSRPTLQAWIRDNVQGKQGLQGVAGKDGKDGANGANGTNGKDGLSAYQIAVANGYTGNQQQWLQSLIGATGSSGSNGEDGVDGLNGWSPILKTVSRGNDIVLQIYDWVGGTGTKPTAGQYLSSDGLINDINKADNIRGTQGEKGSQGEKGIQGEKGADGKSISGFKFNPDLSMTLTYTDNTTTKSDIPPNQYGWATYKDSQYTDTTPYNVPINTQVVIPNNATNKVEVLPTGVTTFYNPTNQKYLLADSDGFYTVRVRFKVAPSSQQSYINLSMSKDTTETPYSEDKILRGDNLIQNVHFETVMYGDTALSSNGLTIQIKTYDRAVNIYNIVVTVAKLIQWGSDMELNLSPVEVDVNIENYIIKSDAFYNVCFITEDDLAPRTVEVKTLNDLLNSGYYRFSLAYDFCRTAFLQQGMSSVFIRAKRTNETYEQAFDADDNSTYYYVVIDTKNIETVLGFNAHINSVDSYKLQFFSSTNDYSDMVANRKIVFYYSPFFSQPYTCCLQATSL